MHLLRRLLWVSVISAIAGIAIAQEPQPATPPASAPASQPPKPEQAPPAAEEPAMQPQPQDTPLLQQPATEGNAYTMRVTSKLVILDAVVTDRNGKLVEGLTKDDFTVLENKDPQTIRNFERAAQSVPPASVSINSTAELDRLAPKAPVNIIVLDEFNTRFEDMAFARYSLKKYLSKQPDKLDEPTMLVAVTLGHFNVLHDYTQDKKAIQSAIDHHFVAYPWRTMSRSWLSEQYSTAISTLMQVAEATTGHQGHKNMIWVGRGFPYVNMANMTPDSSRALGSAVQLCVNMLRDARVTLYTVDPAGISATPPATDLNGQYVDEPFGGNLQFDEMAAATGGRSFYGRNDVDHEIDRSIYEGSNFYTLSYVPSDTSRNPRKYRKIEIVMKRPDLTVTTRKGYYVEPPPPTENFQKPSRRLAFDLMSAANNQMVYDAVKLSASPAPDAADTYIVHISNEALSSAAGVNTNQPIVIAFVAENFDKKGKSLEQIARSITDRSPNSTLATNGLNIRVKFMPNKDAARARFVVRVGQTGKMGTADLMLKKK